MLPLHLRNLPSPLAPLPLTRPPARPQTVDLSNNDLTGPIPSELWYNTLQSLNLANNSISGSLQVGSRLHAALQPSTAGRCVCACLRLCAVVFGLVRYELHEGVP